MFYRDRAAKLFLDVNKTGPIRSRTDEVRWRHRYATHPSAYCSHQPKHSVSPLYNSEILLSELSSNIGDATGSKIWYTRQRGYIKNTTWRLFYICCGDATGYWLCSLRSKTANRFFPSGPLLAPGARGNVCASNLQFSAATNSKDKESEARSY